MRPWTIGSLVVGIVVGAQFDVPAAKARPRLSPASLDLDTCGCLTAFGQPTCEKRTWWALDKTAGPEPPADLGGEAFIFSVTVTYDSGIALTGQPSLKSEEKER